MSCRYFTSLARLAIVVMCVSLLTVPVVGQSVPGTESWVAPRTVDGHPDLQGVWANNNATPLERPAEWADKERLTDEELAELQRAAADVVSSGNDAQFGDQLVLAAQAQIKDADSYDTTGNYNQFWMVDRDFTHQTSLVVDPANGQIPELTAAAVSRKFVRPIVVITRPMVLRIGLWVSAVRILECLELVPATTAIFRFFRRATTLLC